MKLLIAFFLVLMMSACQNESTPDIKEPDPPTPDIVEPEEPTEPDEPIVIAKPLIRITDKRQSYFDDTTLAIYLLNSTTPEVIPSVPYASMQYNDTNHSVSYLLNNQYNSHEIVRPINGLELVPGTMYDVANQTILIATPHELDNQTLATNHDKLRSPCYNLYVSLNEEDVTQVTSHIGAYLLTPNGEKVFYITAEGELYEYLVSEQTNTFIADNIAPSHFTETSAMLYNEQHDALIVKRQENSELYSETGYLYMDGHLTKLTEKMDILRADTIHFTDDYLIYLAEQVYMGDIASVGIIDAALYVKPLNNDAPPIKLNNSARTFEVTDEHLYYITGDGIANEVIDDKTSKLIADNVTSMFVIEDIVYTAVYTNEQLWLRRSDDKEFDQVISYASLYVSEQAAKEGHFVLVTEDYDLYVNDEFVASDAYHVGYDEGFVVIVNENLEVFSYEIASKTLQQLDSPGFEIDEVWVGDCLLMRDNYYLVEDGILTPIESEPLVSDIVSIEEATTIVFNAFPDATIENDPFYQEEAFNVEAQLNETAVQFILSFPDEPESFYLVWVFNDRTYQIRFMQ